MSVTAALVQPFSKLLSRIKTQFSVAFGYPIDKPGVLIVDYIVLAFFILDIILGKKSFIYQNF